MLVCTKQLVILCINYPSARSVILCHIGRAYAWIKDDKISANAFAHQLALNSSEYNVHFDGCHIKLIVDTSRLVCTLCGDGALCRSCLIIWNTTLFLKFLCCVEKARLQNWAGVTKFLLSQRTPESAIDSQPCCIIL